MTRASLDKFGWNHGDVEWSDLDSSRIQMSAEFDLGGKGSGYFEHEGRPGQRGGSVPRSENGQVTIGEVELRRATKSDIPRMKRLRVPPAWQDIHLSVNPRAGLQAVGVDVKGRTQYLYSAKHAERQAAQKFTRLKAFTKALPGIRSKIERDMAKGQYREEATVMYVIDKTGFRIGSDKDTGGDAKAYGASTLTRDHVSVDGDRVQFAFTGKKGVAIEKTVEDATLARIIRDRLATGKDRLFDTTDASVRDYVRARMGRFTPKDFRTYHGTATALAAISTAPVPTSETGLKKAMREVAKRVAEHLGNTPAVALKSYIDPAVFSKWRAHYAA